MLISLTFIASLMMLGVQTGSLTEGQTSDTVDPLDKLDLESWSPFYDRIFSALMNVAHKHSNIRVRASALLFAGFVRNNVTFLPAMDAFRKQLKLQGILENVVGYDFESSSASSADPEVNFLALCMYRIAERMDPEYIPNHRLDALLDNTEVSKLMQQGYEEAEKRIKLLRKSSRSLESAALKEAVADIFYEVLAEDQPEDQVYAVPAEPVVSQPVESEIYTETKLFDISAEDWYATFMRDKK